MFSKMTMARFVVLIVEPLSLFISEIDFENILRSFLPSCLWDNASRSSLRHRVGYLVHPTRKRTLISGRESSISKALPDSEPWAATCGKKQKRRKLFRKHQIALKEKLLLAFAVWSTPEICRNTIVLRISVSTFERCVSRRNRHRNTSERTSSHTETSLSTYRS